MSNSVQLVVTDLDGSLLDHHDYSYEAAAPALQALEEMRIPLVLASSKTRVEMLALREELGNQHPFIAENGAAVFIPERYFATQAKETVLVSGYYRHELVPPRERWLQLLDTLRESPDFSFAAFSSAGVDGVMEMTGLSRSAAELAIQREYSEPLKWRGEEAELPRFLDALAAGGATVLQGGRFYSVAGDSDKGRAWTWLREQYRLAAAAATVYDLAIGDGANDIPMLEAARSALLIPAPERPLPELQRQSGVLVGEGVGPVAWNQGVREWLRRLYQAPEEL